MGATTTELRLDGDDIRELEEVLEDAFGVTFSKGDGQCETAGDLHDLLLAKLREADGSGCATSMVFYRLRAALVQSGADRTALRPSTTVGALAGKNPRSFLRRLEAQSGLKMPWGGGRDVVSSERFVFAAIIAAVFAVLGGFAWIKVATVVGMTLVGLALTALHPGRLPKGCETLGDLARRVTALNYAALVTDGAAVRSDEVWRAVIEVFAEHGGVTSSSITRDTWLTKAPKAA